MHQINNKSSIEKRGVSSQFLFRLLDKESSSKAYSMYSLHLAEKYFIRYDLNKQPTNFSVIIFYRRKLSSVIANTKTGNVAFN